MYWEHWPGSEEMYHNGGDRGWHHGRHQMDTPPPRNYRSRPYRGGYRDHREHDHHSSYHDNPCRDRNYDDHQFMEYQDHSYPEYYEKKSFNEYREHREPAYNRGGRHDGEPAYNRGGRHDGDYQRESYYRGGYQRGRGESSRYRGNVPESPPKKYSHKPFKAYKKEDQIRLKSSTPEPAQKVNHNPGRTVVKLTPDITEDESETTFSKAKSPEQDANSSEDCEKSLHETAKIDSVKEDVKVDFVVKEIMTSPSDQRNETLLASNIKTEIAECKKEVNFQAEQTVEEDQLPMSLNPGKRAHLEEEDFGVCMEQREGDSFLRKRRCSNQEADEHYLEKTVQIPLLGCWGDIPSESVVSASTSEQENTVPAVDCKLPETPRELRTALILERKEQLEVAFGQDCKTFAVVASTLLKKDPSIGAAVTSALRSSLQEMAELCVQELNNFIDHYDSDV